MTTKTEEKKRKSLRVEFVPVRFKGVVVLPEALVQALPAKIVLFTTIQYHTQIESWKKALEAAGKKVFLLQPKHAVAPGHLLGCAIQEWDVDADAFFFVGDGLFHPTALALHNALPVWHLNPQSGTFSLLDDERVAQWRGREKGALATFHTAKKVGVLVTTKPGQQRLVLARELRERFPDKEFFIFLCDTIDFQGLEDFPFVECWVNTACPRLGLDDAARTTKPLLDIGVLGFDW